MSHGWLRRLRSSGVGLAFAFGLLTAGFLHMPYPSAAQQPAAPGVSVSATRPPVSAAVASLQNFSEAFATVAEHVKPSVVYIKSGRKPDQTRQSPRMQVPPGFEPFFRNMPPMQMEPRFQESSGSGFIGSKDGYILTNNHVVDGSDQVMVRLLDRREVKAKGVGTDPNTDLAVLKIDANNLTPAPLGSSSAARVGEWVLAVGNPLGDNLTFTVTSGIISAKGRTLALPGQSDRSIQDFIQTDAAINPGNSGGPLVSVRGEVIGVNSAIASETGFYSGYGFAIPMNLVRTVMTQLIESGRVHRAALGVSIDNVTLNDAAYVGLPEIRGVVVKDIPNDDSPAKAAGIMPGDVIIAVDGKPVERVGQLQQVIGFRKPGDVVKVEVARKGGVRKTFNVKLQALNDQPQLAAADQSDSDEAGATGGSAMNRLGVSVEPVTPDVAQQLQLPNSMRGLVVTDVTPGGPAWETLLDDPQRNGPDIILSVEGKPVKTEADLRNALKGEKPGSIVTLGIYNPRAQGKRVEGIKWGEKKGGT